MSKQLIFVDDSGDPGFRGATSSNFIMASAVFTSSEVATKLNDLIDEFRKSLGWQEEAEFKFRKTNKQIVKDLLEVVSKHDFEICAVYVDKSTYARILPVFDEEKLYNWTIKELLKTIPLNDASIVIDGRSTREYRLRTASYLRREINASSHKIIDIKTRDSAKDNLIQLADLIAGAINRSMQKDKTDSKTYYKIIKRNIASIKRLDLKNK